MIRHPWRFLLCSLAAAWAVDLLFWEKPAGISFIIWTVFLLIAALILLHGEGEKPARQSWILMGGILILATIVFFRQEPTTSGIGVMLTLGLIWLLVSTYKTGFWTRFRLVDYITSGFMAIFAALVRPWELLRRNNDAPNGDNNPQKKKPRRWLPYLRGVLLSLPVLFVLGGLLVSADPVFSAWMEKISQIFRIEWNAEYFFRMVYILGLAYLFSGLYLFAIKPKHAQEKPDPDKPMTQGFLGSIETAVVLVCVNLLFAVFLAIQFRYLFGGQLNISETGFTYAEYARRGFNELLIVAVLSLLMYQGLAIITRMESKPARNGFMGLSLLLIAQVIVILVSAYQRLLMYEDAYGFTRLRMVSHGFMIWLGILLAVVFVLEIAGRRGWFALAALVCLFGFAVSLAAVNIDGQIVYRNVVRSSPDKLDVEYLKELSNDAVPAMSDLYLHTGDTQFKDQLGMQLACRKKVLEETDTPWQSFTLSEARARKILTGLEEPLSKYRVVKDNREWVIVTGRELYYCSPQMSYIDSNVD